MIEPIDCCEVSRSQQTRQTHIRAGLPELLLVVGPAHERDLGRIEDALVVHDQTLAALALDDARIAPGEVVHAPERVERDD